MPLGPHHAERHLPVNESTVVSLSMDDRWHGIDGARVYLVLTSEGAIVIYIPTTCPTVERDEVGVGITPCRVTGRSPELHGIPGHWSTTQ